MPKTNLHINSHIEDYINYYSSLPHPPEFAILIKGAWGSGKSYLVNKCIEKLEIRKANPIKFLPVSLYGITNVSDIEAKFFQILNPVLSSKKMILAGSIAKSVLKGTLKIDLDGDGKSDSSISPSIPNIDFTKYLTNTKDFVIVFDDLERCPMPLVDILGYINYFVEKEGYHVILIGDEDKIQTTDEDGNQIDDTKSYQYIKEKLIGKTLEVKGNIENTFSGLINLIKEPELKKLFDSNKIEIFNIFSLAGYNNLRSLRRSILDFQQLWNNLDNEITDNHDCMEHLLVLHTIISFEYYSGNLKGDEIDQILQSAEYLRELNEDSDPETNRFSRICKKYNDYQNQMFTPLISLKNWEEIIDKGMINKSEINKSILENEYFYNDKTATWRKLWHFLDLEELEFNKYLKDVLSQFNERKYVELGIIRHIAGMFITFTKNNLLNGFTEDNLVEKFQSYIDEIFNENKVDLIDAPYWEQTRTGGYAGLVYHANEDKLFTEIDKHMEEKVNQRKKEKVKIIAGTILETMKSNPKDLYSLLTYSEYDQGEFQTAPILHLIDCDDFMSSFNKLNNADKGTVVDIFFHRYRYKNRREDLSVEFDLIERVMKQLNKEKEKEKEKNKLGYIIYENLLDRLQPINKAIISRNKESAK